MGGFNAAQLYLKRGSLFKRAALLCPAITSISPFATKEEVDAYMKRTGAKPFNVLSAISLAKQFFPTAEEYNASAPLVVADKYLGPDSPPVHVSCGMQDGYGFQEGAKMFADLALDRKVPEATWQELEGGHCTFDAKAVADFILPE